MKIRHILVPHTEENRFLRFSIVGGSSFVVGVVTFNVCYLFVHRLILCNATAYVLSVLNGFVWNRAWTFRDKRAQTVWQQGLKFLSVNLIGWAINLSLIVLLVAMTTSIGTKANFFDHVASVLRTIISGKQKEHFSLLLLNAVGVVATGIVLIWNYIGHKNWSFRH